MEMGFSSMSEGEGSDTLPTPGLPSRGTSEPALSPPTTNLLSSSLYTRVSYPPPGTTSGSKFSDFVSKRGQGGGGGGGGMNR